MRFPSNGNFPSNGDYLTIEDGGSHRLFHVPCWRTWDSLWPLKTGREFPAFSKHNKKDNATVTGKGNASCLHHIGDTRHIGDSTTFPVFIWILHNWVDASQSDTRQPIRMSFSETTEDVCKPMHRASLYVEQTKAAIWKYWWWWCSSGWIENGGPYMDEIKAQIKHLSKQSTRPLFETPSRSLWRQCNVIDRGDWPSFTPAIPLIWVFNWFLGSGLPRSRRGRYSYRSYSVGVGFRGSPAWWDAKIFRCENGGPTLAT